MSEFAIEVKHLDKMYKLYNKPSDRLREALGFKVPRERALCSPGCKFRSKKRRDGGYYRNERFR